MAPNREGESRWRDREMEQSLSRLIDDRLRKGCKAEGNYFSQPCLSGGRQDFPNASQNIEAQNALLGDPNGMSWLVTAIFLFAETTSLGVLGLPQAVREVGLVPGLIFINALYLLMWYTGLIVFRFKMQNFQIRSFADALVHIFGQWSRWLGIVMMVLYLIFVMAAHIVGFSMMVTTTGGDSTCRIIWKAFAAGLYLVFTAKRSFNAGAWTYCASCLSIFVAAIVAMFGVGLVPPSDHHWYIVTPPSSTSLAKGAEAVSYIIVASMAHIAYPTIVSEMKRPHDFPKALSLQQISTLMFANVVAIVFYLRVGLTVASPSLDSAPPTLSRVAWAISSPSIVVCGVIAAMIAAKLLYALYWGENLRQVRAERNWRSIGSWLTITFLLTVAAWLLAWGVPIFNHLFSLMGSLFGTSFALVFPSMFWFQMNWVDVTASGMNWFGRPNRADSGPSESGSGSTRKETFTPVERRTTNSSQETDQPVPARVLGEKEPRESLWVRVREYVLTVRARPLFGTLNTIIFLVGIAMSGLGTYGAVIGIINASGEETSIAC